MFRKFQRQICLKMNSFEKNNRLLSSNSRSYLEEDVQSTIDNYRGLHLDISKLNCDSIQIENIIQNYIDKNNNPRTVWIKLTIKHYSLLERLSKFGFKIHHSKDEILVLFKSFENSSRIPKYAFTNIGVGAIVINNKDQVLFVKEKHPYNRQMWKFPGGYVEQGENLNKAIEREVLEETGIESEFKSILLLRHLHKFAFDCADMYFVCLLMAKNEQIKHCKDEIEQCQWSSIDNMIDHLSPFNRLCLEQYLKYKDNPLSIVVKELQTPYLPVPSATIYAQE